jgi:hypothetical protein
VNTLKNERDAPTMAKEDRLNWICAYFANTIHTSQQRTNGGPWRDVTSSYIYGTMHGDFSDVYLVVTNAPYRPMVLGPNVCDMLARDLKELHDQGVLERWRSGIEGMGSGWPKWTWHYKVRDTAFQVCKERGDAFKAKYPDLRTR